MGYSERITWSQLLASVVGTIVYIAIVLPQLLERPVAEIDWVWPMIWTIVGAIVGAIVLSILWGIVAGMRDPEEEHTADQRDREIEWLGDRVGVAFMVIGSLGGLILAMVHAPWFWIGQSLYFGFFLAASVGAVARLVIYRRGMP